VALRQAIGDTFTELEADPEIRVVVLTGAGRAFSAGLDLKELGSGDATVGAATSGKPTSDPVSAMKDFSGPIIGAINGVAITGGFELALACDVLIASTNARFADTHARVGVMPGWGLTVLLPRAVGIRRAREMSFTGNFMLADEALAFGLVNHVVAHDDLIAFTRQLAHDIIGNDQVGVRQIRSTYAQIVADDDSWEIEARDSRAWRRSNFSPDQIAARRAAIQSRGKTQ